MTVGYPIQAVKVEIYEFVHALILSQFLSCLIRFTYSRHASTLIEQSNTSQLVSQSCKPEAKDQYLFCIVRM